MIQLMTCPICKKSVSAVEAAESKTLPFCSRRCQQVDFFRWTDGRYAIEESLDDRPDIVEKLAEEFDEFDEADG